MIVLYCGGRTSIGLL
ncbi:hypothetical protein LINPERPRIM_LOCUS7471 [Linum perenne]